MAVFVTWDEDHYSGDQHIATLVNLPVDAEARTGNAVHSLLAAANE